MTWHEMNKTAGIVLKNSPDFIGYKYAKTAMW